MVIVPSHADRGSIAVDPVWISRRIPGPRPIRDAVEKIARHAMCRQCRGTVIGRRTQTVSSLKSPLVPVLCHQHHEFRVNRKHIPNLRVLQVHPGGILRTHAGAGRLARRRRGIARFPIHRHLAATGAPGRTRPCTCRNLRRRRQRCRHDRRVVRTVAQLRRVVRSKELSRDPQSVGLS